MTDLTGKVKGIIEREAYVDFAAAYEITNADEVARKIIAEIFDWLAEKARASVEAQYAADTEGAEFGMQLIMADNNRRASVQFWKAMLEQARKEAGV